MFQKCLTGVNLTTPNGLVEKEVKVDSFSDRISLCSPGRKLILKPLGKAVRGYRTMFLVLLCLDLPNRVKFRLPENRNVQM